MNNGVNFEIHCQKTRFELRIFKNASVIQRRYSESPYHNKNYIFLHSICIFKVIGHLTMSVRINSITASAMDAKDGRKVLPKFESR